MSEKKIRTAVEKLFLKKPVKIDTENEEFLNAFLKQENGRKENFVLYSFCSLQSLSLRAEAACLQKGLTKKEKKGAIWVDFAEAPAKSYKWSFDGYRAAVVYSGKEWLLKEYSFIKMYPGSQQKDFLLLSPASLETWKKRKVKELEEGISAKAA